MLESEMVEAKAKGKAMLDLFKNLNEVVDQTAVFARRISHNA